MKPKLLILSSILILSALLRLICLNKIPAGINNDELHFVMNAKSIFYGYSNIEGNINPFKLGELSSLLFSPIIGPVPSNLFTARLPYAFIGCLSVLQIYLLVKRIAKNERLALVSALIFSINPWSVYVSRTSFDAPIAIFFYLFSINLLASKKPKYILLSTLTGLMAFNSYIGTKIIYFPIIAIVSYFMWHLNHKINSKLYLFASLFSLLITINFAFKLSSNLVSGRIEEIQHPFSQSIKDQVNLERQQSLQVPIIKEVLTNKYTIYLKNFTQKYLYNFSTDILFLDGDHTATGSLWKHGYFYYIDSILIIFGIIYLFNRYKKLLILLLSLIILSPIPEAIRIDTLPAYVFHSSFLFPFMSILIGAGVLFIWSLKSNYIVRIIFILFYVLCFANFIDIYFFKAPIYQSEAFSTSKRVLSKYLNLESQKNREIFILTREPEVLFRSFLFYSNSYKKDKYSFIKNIYSKSQDIFTIENVHFTNNQLNLPLEGIFTLIYDSNNYVFKDNKLNLYISNLADVGNIYTINKGHTCQNFTYSKYPNNIHLKDLNIERLPEKEFCEKYLNIK
ncbi:MAG: hypothetical protein PHR98_00485 [Candidatus Shapirobacteria bacterium]|nr:hypothetical protein [Candidatus Shapirobacteria bacterium]